MKLPDGIGGREDRLEKKGSGAFLREGGRKSAWAGILRRAALCALMLLLGFAFSRGFAPANDKAWAGVALVLLFCFADRAAGPKQAFWGALFFAVGEFGFGLSWLLDSMILHGRIAPLLACAGLAGLSALLGLFLAAPAALAAALFERGALRGFAFAGLWTFFEYLRGDGLANFSWLTPALLALDTPAAGLMPIGGEALANLALLASAAAAAGIFSVFLDPKLRAARRAGRAALKVAGCLTAALLLWAGILTVEDWTWSEALAEADDCRIALVQADFPVVDAFNSASADSKERILKTDALVKTIPDGAVDLIATPEGVILSDLAHLKPEARKALDGMIRDAGAPLVFNGFRQGRGAWFNTAWLAVDAGLYGRARRAGEPVEPSFWAVDKRRLVPFGEYVPPGFRWFVDMLGIPLSDLTPGEAVQENWLLPARKNGAFVELGMLICYENIDGQVARGFWAEPDGGPNILLVTANLGWFGDAVKAQHLAMTRLRALETARPIASVNMNGLSAFVDEKGGILKSAPDNAALVLSAGLRPRTGEATPFVRLGCAPALFAALGLVLLCVLIRRRKS